jgi:hypothetical protein
VLTKRRHSVPSRPLLDQREGEAMAYPISDKRATFTLGDRSFDTPYNPGDLAPASRHLLVPLLPVRSAVAGGNPPP